MIAVSTGSQFSDATPAGFLGKEKKWLKSLLKGGL
jgi:hypothetical protein